MKTARGLREDGVVKAFRKQNPAWGQHHLIAGEASSGEDTYWNVYSSPERVVGQVYKNDKGKTVVETNASTPSADDHW